jgi:O-antigen/teichoic acid export membrane protein
MRPSTPNTPPDDTTAPDAVPDATTHTAPPDAATNALPKDITRSTVHGLLWIFSGTWAQTALRLVVLMILARLLKPQDFGLVAAALAITGFSEIFSQVGIGPALVQSPKIEEKHIRTGFTVSVALGLLLAAFFWVAAPWLAHFLLKDPQGLVPILRACGLVFPISGVAVVAGSLLSRDLQFRRIATVQLSAYTAGYAVVGVSLAWLGYGPWALVGASLTQELGNTLGRLWSRPHAKRFMFDWPAAKELFVLGGGFTVARIGNYVATQGDNIVVGRWLGAQALGFYGRSYQLVILPVTLLGQVLHNVLFPVMARLQDDRERLALAYKRGVAFIAIVVMPISVVLWLLAPEFILTLFGPQWAEAAVPFQVLCVGMLFRTSYRMSDSIARSAGAVYRRAGRQWIYAACVLGCAWFGTRWGLAGVAWGVVAALTVNFLLMAQLSLSITGLPWSAFVAAHGPALLLSTAVGLQTWAVAAALRSLGLAAPLVLLGGATLAGVTAVLLALLAPRWVLGADGIWIVNTLTRQLPARLRSKLKGPLAGQPKGESKGEPKSEPKGIKGSVA